jgi:hypothetical protein
MRTPFARAAIVVATVVAVFTRCQSSSAAIVTVAGPSAFPAGTPTVHFEGLLKSNNGGPSLPSYTELGVTFNNSIGSIKGYTSPSGTGLVTPFAQDPNTVTFPYAVTSVGWMESFDSSPSVVLYADLDGTQPIGKFDISIPPVQDLNFHFHGFQSDTPFMMMSLEPTHGTYLIDDLMFATPEPGAAGILLGGIGLMTWNRRRARRHR